MDILNDIYTYNPVAPTVRRHSEGTQGIPHCAHRVLLPPPDDTVFAVASLKGATLLAWVEHMLGIPPFFVQSAQVNWR